MAESVAAKNDRPVLMDYIDWHYWPNISESNKRLIQDFYVKDIRERRLSYGGTLYSDVYDCSYMISYEPVFKTGPNAKRQISTWPAWDDTDEEDIPDYVFFPGKMWEHSKLEQFLICREVFIAYKKFSAQQWNKGYRDRLMKAPILAAMDRFAAATELHPDALKHMKSGVSEYIDWICLMDYDVWLDIAATVGVIATLDISQVQIDNAKPIELTQAKPRKLSESGKASRKLSKLINKLTQKGAIRDDLDRVLNDRLDRPSPSR